MNVYRSNGAVAHNSLGNALVALGKRTGETGRLKEAVAEYREALKESTLEGMPLIWAATQNNLGNVLLALGEWECVTDSLEEALKAFEAALEVFEAAKAAPYVEGTKANLQRVQNLLQQRKR
jgi:tetratricopeptide (TPR) repeat protein